MSEKREHGDRSQWLWGLAKELSAKIAKKTQLAVESARVEHEAAMRIAHDAERLSLEIDGNRELCDRAWELMNEMASATDEVHRHRVLCAALMAARKGGVDDAFAVTTKPNRRDRRRSPLVRVRTDQRVIRGGGRLTADGMLQLPASALDRMGLLGSDGSIVCVDGRGPRGVQIVPAMPGRAADELGLFLDRDPAALNRDAELLIEISSRPRARLTADGMIQLPFYVLERMGLLGSEGSIVCVDGREPHGVEMFTLSDWEDLGCNDEEQVLVAPCAQERRKGNSGPDDQEPVTGSSAGGDTPPSDDGVTQLGEFVRVVEAQKLLWNENNKLRDALDAEKKARLTDANEARVVLLQMGEKVRRATDNLAAVADHLEKR